MEEKDINEVEEYNVEDLKKDPSFMEYYEHFTDENIDTLPKDDLDLIVNMYPKMKAYAEENNMGLVEIMEAIKSQHANANSEQKNETINNNEEENRDVDEDLEKKDNDGILEVDDFAEILNSSIDELEEKNEEEKEEFEELKFNRDEYLEDEKHDFYIKTISLGGRYNLFNYEYHKKENDYRKEIREKLFKETDIYKIINSKNRDFSSVIASNIQEILMNKKYGEDVISNYVKNYISYLAYESVNSTEGILTEKEIKDNFKNSRTAFFKSMSKEILGVSFEYDAKAQELIENKAQTKALNYNNRLSLMNHYTNQLNDKLDSDMNKDEVLNSSRQQYNALKSLVENQSVWKKIFHPVIYSEEKNRLKNFKNNLMTKFNVTEKEVDHVLTGSWSSEDEWNYDLFISYSKGLEKNSENNANELILHLKNEKMYTQNKEINELKNDKVNVKINDKDIEKDVKLEKDNIKK